MEVKGDVPVSIVRPSIVFGQEDSRHGTLYALLKCVLPEANERFVRCRLPQQVLNWHEI